MSLDIPRPRRRILVVDDNRDSASMLAVLLRHHGHEVAEAHDGPTALQAAGTFAPEIVFLDLLMPGMDGFAVAQGLREMELRTMSRAIIIALSAFGHAAYREATAEEGFDGHLQKPFAAEELLAMIAGYDAASIPRSPRTDAVQATP